MTPKDMLGMAFMNLWRRKLRAFLTVLGMVVGTASIVVMVSLGIGINVSYQESLAEAGSLTKITVSPQNWDKYYQEMEARSGGGFVMIGGRGNNGPETVNIDDKAIAAFKKMEHVSAVTPILSTYSSYFKSGKFFNSSQIYGIDPEYAETFGIKLQEGEMFSQGGGSTVEVVVGSQFAYNFMNAETYASALDRNGNPRINPMTSRIRLTFDPANIYAYWGQEEGAKPGKMYNLRVTGMIAEGTDWELNYGVYTDVASLKKLMRANKNFIYRQSENSDYDSAWVMADSVDSVSAISEQLQQMGYGTSSLGDILKQVQDSSASLRALLGAIGGVALLVAAIGIMNTMMMAIYERTKEIGVIKVLGCRMRDILRMFLSESAFIGFFGGVIGVGLSYGLGALLNNHFLQEMGLRSVIPVWLSIGALAFSVVVAMLSGLYPSIKAMRLSPLAAIRTE